MSPHEPDPTEAETPPPNPPVTDSVEAKAKESETPLISTRSDVERPQVNTTQRAANSQNRTAEVIAPPFGGQVHEKQHSPTQLPFRHSEKIVVELHKAPETKNQLQKIAGFFKDVMPIVISIATGLATVATGFIAYYTYSLNATQSALTQADLKVKALEDFKQEEKRTLAAIKLAQYGPQTLPVVRQALSVADPDIREGVMITSELMFTSPQAISREEFLKHMNESFREKSPLLNLGVLQFYTKVAPLLTNSESNVFDSLLKERLGDDGARCGNESGEFIEEVARYIGNKSSAETREAPSPQQLVEFKTLLLGLGQKCSWNKPTKDVDSPYEAARRQIPTALAEVARNLSQSDRASVLASLDELAKRADASPQLKSSINAAVEKIRQIQGPQ